MPTCRRGNWLPTDDSLSQYEVSETGGATELEPQRDSPEAATEVATVVVVLNVPKLAEVLSQPPRPVANREDRGRRGSLGSPIRNQCTR